MNSDKRKKIAYKSARVIITIFVIFSSCVWIFGLLYRFNFTPDYTVFWTASRMVFVHPERIYDSYFMTIAQMQFISPLEGLRPWAYPPSGLLLFIPFSIFPFHLSWLIWTIVSLSAYVLAIRKIVAGKALLLTIVSPAVVYSVLAGQVSLLIAAAIIASVEEMPKRPLFAGILLGITASIKPQSVLLVPLLCVVQRRWQTLIAFGMAGIFMVLMSAPLGVSLWKDWIGALAEFQGTVQGMGLLNRSMTPTGIVAKLHLNPGSALLLRISLAAIGISFAIWAFRQTSPQIHITGLVVGGLMSSPYAMYYDLAVLMPIAVAMLYSGRLWGLVGSLPLATSAGMFTVPLMAFGTWMDHRKSAEFADGSLIPLSRQE